MRNRPIVKVAPPKERPPQPALEETIRAAAERWRAENLPEIENTVAAILNDGLKDLLNQTLGLRRDMWDRKVSFDTGSSYNENAVAIRTKATEAARALIAEMDFGPVELTTAEVRAIKAAYRRVLKDAAEQWAERLAQQHAEAVARQVLDMPEPD